VTDEVASWMDNIQHGAEEEEEIEMLLQEQREKEKANEIDNKWPRFGAGAGLDSSRQHSSWYKYSHQANQASDETQREQPSEGGKKRSTRAATASTRTTCSLFIQTDPLLWKHFYEAEKRNADNTRKEITSLIAQHVKAVNAIYMETKFDGRFPHRMTRFEVQRIKIDDYEACEQNYVGEENKFCLPNIDVSNFLNLHSQGNHEDFCLAYVFTYRYVCLFGSRCCGWTRLNEPSSLFLHHSSPIQCFILFPLIAILLVALWVWLGWRHLPALQAASVNATRRTRRTWLDIRARLSGASIRASLLLSITTAACRQKFLS